MSEGKTGGDLMSKLNYGPEGFHSTHLAAMERLELETVSIGNKLFSGFRGDYGGFMMGGMVMTLVAGGPIVNPVAAAGVCCSVARR